VPHLGECMHKRPDAAHVARTAGPRVDPPPSRPRGSHHRREAPLSHALPLPRLTCLTGKSIPENRTVRIWILSAFRIDVDGSSLSQGR